MGSPVPPSITLVLVLLLAVVVVTVVMVVMQGRACVCGHGRLDHRHVPQGAITHPPTTHSPTHPPTSSCSNTTDRRAHSQLGRTPTRLPASHHPLPGMHDLTIPVLLAAAAAADGSRVRADAARGSVGGGRRAGRGLRQDPRLCARRTHQVRTKRESRGLNTYLLVGGAREVGPSWQIRKTGSNQNLTSRSLLLRMSWSAN